jgi:tetratricopeptide (TPR) repeat protein
VSARARILAALAALALVAVAGAGCADHRPRQVGPPPGDPLREVEAAELYQHGLAMADRGDFVRAEQYLVASIERGYPEERVLPALLRACLSSSRLRAALSYAEPYLQRNPSAWSLRLLVASIYLGVGDVDRARTALEKVIRDAPAQPDAYYLLGLVLRDKIGDRPAASRTFARYLALAPEGLHAAEVRDALSGLTDPPGEQVPPGGAAPDPAPAPASAPAPPPHKVPARDAPR